MRSTYNASTNIPYEKTSILVISIAKLKMNSNDTYQDVLGNQFLDQEDAIGIAYDVLALLSFLTFVPAYVCTYSYLNSVSLAKECLQLYLYKDIISSLLLWRTLWAIEVIISYWNEEGTSEIQAMVTSFGLWFVILYFVLITIFLKIHNLRMAKTNTIDPTIPWLGEDDTSAIKRVRLGCCLVVVIFLGTTFGTELYPGYFYIIIGDLDVDLTMSDIIYRGTLILLLLIIGILTAITRRYRTTLEPQVDKNITKYIMYIVVITCLTLVTLQVLELTRLTNIKTSWEFYQIFLTPLNVFAPFLLLFRSDQLKTHSIRYLKNKYDDIFILCIYLVPTFAFIMINLLVYISFYCLNW